MVIDDNPVNVLVSTLQLERCGAQVSGFEDVLLALETLFNGDPGQFHVVLMDLQMPKLDGVDAVRRIRRQPSLDMLPVVALSGEIDPSAIDGALAVGMADFVQKPFNTAELAAKLAVFKPRR
jgi:CheY-like chemotaxis protein